MSVDSTNSFVYGAGRYSSPSMNAASVKFGTIMSALRKQRHLHCKVHVEHRVHTAAVRHSGVDKHNGVFLLEVIDEIRHYVYLFNRAENPLYIASNFIPSFSSAPLSGAYLP